jgi:hypothetical protein
MGERPGLPDQVAGVAQQRDGLLGVGQRFGVPTEVRPHPYAADQDPAGEHTGPAGPDRLERGQPTVGVTGHDQGHAQARQDLRLAVGIGRLAGMPVRGLQLRHSLVDVAEVAMDDTCGLVSYRGIDVGRGVRENIAGNGEGVSGPRECERKQLVVVHGNDQPSRYPDIFRS